MLETIIGYALSPHAIELVKSGVAVFCKGGIRSVETGKILELAKPVLNIAKRAVSPLQIASFATQIIGDGYAAYKLNRIDKKLDGMIAQLQKIAEAVSHIGTIEILSWANLGMQLVNVGVSAAGFYLTMQKLDAIGGELHAFYERYQYDRESDKLEKYHDHMSNITTQMGQLQERYGSDIFDQHDFLNRAIMIEKECNEACSFLRATLRDFSAGKMEHRLACQILFTLAPAYGGLVNEFCSQYRCVTGKQHKMFDNWYSILDQINSKSFRAFMQQQMAFDPYYAAVSPEKRHESLMVAFGSLDQLQNTMQVCRAALEETKPDHLVSPEELINTRAWTALGAQLGADTDEALTAMFNASLQHAQPVEGEDTVFVPLQAVVTG